MSKTVVDLPTLILENGMYITVSFATEGVF